MTNAKSLPVDRVHALEDLLDMYHFRDEEVLLCEAFANAVDVFIEDKIKSPKIEITMNKINSDIGYINFHNNGTPMTEKQFQKYHVIAGSYKTKGGGIGFAGVGAKVFLVSKLGGEIITITGKNNSDFMASRMFKTEDDVKYEIIDDLSTIFGKENYTHNYGTTYRVRLNQHAYKYFKERLPHIVQFWWNYALLKKQFTVVVDGKEILPFDPKYRFIGSFTWKGKKINCYCWITKDKTMQEQRHIVYSAFGKRIMNELINQPISLKQDYYDRVFCLIDVSHIAKHIRTDKESFDGNWETNQTRQAAQKFFVNFLTEQGLVGRDITKPQSSEIVNEFTKELDRILKTKEFQELNPFLSPKKRSIPMPDSDGDIAISQIEGEGPTGGEGSGEGGGTDGGHGTGTAFVEDDDGAETGIRKERQSKGIRIIPTDEFPNEKEEAWVDLLRGAICINTAHPFYVQMVDLDRLGRFEKFNINRILIEALIKFKNDELKENWDPKKTLEKFRDLLHKTWKV